MVCLNIRICAALVLIPASAIACDWDRDTLVHEATQMPDVIQAATGRFERNPPLYYQMRIDRESVEVKQHPERLDLYDDIGVAYSRLEKDETAITWMDRKRARMGDLSKAKTLDGKRDALSEAAYRYYANIGTFRLLHWMRHGSDSAKVTELYHSKEDIAAAIAINPDAHFGRETVQLQWIDWLISLAIGSKPTSLAEVLTIQQERRGPPYEPNVQKQIKGIIGLIALGSGWESPDLFRALESQVNVGGYDGGQKLACFVSLRTQELIDSGKLPYEPDEEIGIQLLPKYFNDGQAIIREFGRLRKEAETWQQERTAFMMSRLKAGRHPDTDPNFWDGYVERPAPKVEYTWLESRTIEQIIYMALGIACLVPTILCIVGVYVVRRIRRRNEVIILD